MTLFSRWLVATTSASGILLGWFRRICLHFLFPSFNYCMTFAALRGSRSFEYRAKFTRLRSTRLGPFSSVAERTLKCTRWTTPPARNWNLSKVQYYKRKEKKSRKNLKPKLMLFIQVISGRCTAYASHPMVSCMLPDLRTARSASGRQQLARITACGNVRRTLPARLTRTFRNPPSSRKPLWPEQNEMNLCLSTSFFQFGHGYYSIPKLSNPQIIFFLCFCFAPITSEEIERKGVDGQCSKRVFVLLQFFRKPKQWTIIEDFVQREVETI